MSKGSVLTIDTVGGGRGEDLKGPEGGELPGQHGSAVPSKVHADAGLDGSCLEMGTSTHVFDLLHIPGPALDGKTAGSGIVTLRRRPFRAPSSSRVGDAIQTCPQGPVTDTNLDTKG